VRVGDWPRVISDHANSSGPIFICCGVERWMDESASTTCHRIPHRGESGSSGTDQKQTNAIYRRPAPIGREGKELGRKLVAQVATIVTPEKLMAWHRKLIAHKYDGSLFRFARRPSREPLTRATLHHVKLRCNRALRPSGCRASIH
jgi:hypothetical protein